MGDLYRSVEELPESALDYLRDSLYWGEGDSIWWDDLSDRDKALVAAANYPSAITNEILFSAFEDVLFVPEDFTSDAGDDWSKV